MLDQTGYDLLEGLGINRSAVATEQTVIRYASTSLHPVVIESDVLTLRVDQQFAASAQIAIDLYVALGY